MKIKGFIIILLAVCLFAQGVSAQQYASIGKGVLHVLGIGLTVDPSQLTVPINTGTGVNTKLAASASGFDVPLPQDLTIAAELTGPGISKPQLITTSPNGMLMIPPLPSKGTYILDNIRLMSRGS